MKKRYILLVIFILLVCFLGNYASFPPIFAEQEMIQNIKFRSYGDSIAAGDTLADNEQYVENHNKGLTTVCKDSYIDVFTKNYISLFGGEVKCYAKSGATTTDLVETLSTYTQETATDYNDFLKTDVFTVCIGANNLLGPLMECLENISAGLDLNEFDKKLEQNFEKFKSDYKVIYSTLSKAQNAKIIFTTIYNPYKFLYEGLKQNETLINSYDILKIVKNCFDYTMPYLQSMNEEIKGYATNQNVIVVDTYENFDNLKEETYGQYINAVTNLNVLIQKIFPMIMQGMSLDSPQLISQIKLFLDPHPTVFGHSAIADYHKTSFVLANINVDQTIKDKNNLYLNVQMICDDDAVVKIYKNVNNIESEVEYQKTENGFCVSGQNLTQDGQIYLRVYDKEEKNVYFESEKLDFKAFTTPTSTSFIISSNLDFSDLIDLTSQVKITVSSDCQIDDYEFEIYKNINENLVFIDKMVNGSLFISADKLLGQGKLFAKVYKNGNYLTKTNELEFSVNIETQDIEIEQTENDNNTEDDKQNKLTVYILVAFFGILGVSSIITFVVVFKSFNRKR